MQQVRLKDIVLTRSPDHVAKYINVDSAWKRDLSVNGGDAELAWIASKAGEEWDHMGGHAYVSYLMIMLIIFIT